MVTNKRIVLKLSLIGLVVFSFVSFAVHANGNETALKTKTEDQQAKSPNLRRIVVAIGSFENKSKATDEIVNGIRTRIQQCVVGTRKFKVVEREQLKAAMSEQALAAAGVAKSKGDDVPVTGKIQPAFYIVYGKVLYYGAEKHVAKGDGFACSLVKSKIELEVKVANCQTGDIMAIKTVVGHGMDRVIVTRDSKSSAGQGGHEAIDEVGHAVADWLRDLVCPAKVLIVNNAEVTIDMNENEVKEGDVFDVVEDGGVMVDPDNGTTLQIDGNCIGRVAITRTGLQTSKAESVDGGRLSTEKLDMRKHAYKLRRVTKTALKNEAKRECLRKF